ncbi:Calmodulin-like protein 1 [Zea mays]|jgi:calcium-binding protein CML|uniref:Polcalcin Jun o 2 n=2 Tax=Zea mays TaxID=4577 RepID=B6T7W4_MAIZE|nr:polcalcin Jun o 2 [Zea mays]ACG33197.1 polcalcin Jun o 2 [Zea mays]ONM55467.1 Polcalcin Jun o 2 [Zea mays]PWZ14018.1 Calmodulin-like protein 1 [Zea mays]|eukprot:NP_001148866.1 polcalcin Jun o 2 [Zea mays]
MSHLNILSFKYNLAKLRSKAGRRRIGRALSARDRQFSDLSTYRPDEEEMRKVFGMIAGQPRGVNKRDLQLLLERFGKADAAAEARRMLCVADHNKDGYMDLEEFMEVHRNGVQLGDIRRAFFVFDRDGDGRISAEEVMAVLRKLGQSCGLDDCREMVREVDRNGDGFVDMDDFMAMMTRPRRRP